MLGALRPLTPSPRLNTVLIMPDCDEEIMTGIFERFDEVAKAGGILTILRVRRRTLPRRKCHSGRTSRPINNETHRHLGSVTVCGDRVLAQSVRAGETVKCRRLVRAPVAAGSDTGPLRREPSRRRYQ